MSTTRQRRQDGQLDEALHKAGLAATIRMEQDLGYFTWAPHRYYYGNSQSSSSHRAGKRRNPRYKSIAKATAEEIRAFTVSDVKPRRLIQQVDKLRLPIQFQSNLPKQGVVTKFPYGNIGVAALYHAKKKRCDLEALDFYCGGSALEVLSAERKTGRTKTAPYLIMKVPGTNIITLRYNINIFQDYTVPGFQFERLLTGQPLDHCHDDNVSTLTEHVQLLTIYGGAGAGGDSSIKFRVLMSAEVDAVNDNGDPVEIKLLKTRTYGGSKVFFQMIGSGSRTLYKGKHEDGVLTSVQVLELEDMAERFADNVDVGLRQGNLIRNMERIKEWDRLGNFDNGQVYRIDFNPQMEFVRVQQKQSLFPTEAVTKEVLGI